MLYLSIINILLQINILKQYEIWPSPVFEDFIFARLNVLLRKNQYGELSEMHEKYGDPDKLDPKYLKDYLEAIKK